MSDRIRLSQEVPNYLSLASQEDTGLRRRARDEITRAYGGITEELIWQTLRENDRYHDIANFSSRPVGNEETVYMILMALPPSFSRDLLMRYNEQRGVLRRTDVSAAYRTAMLTD